MNNYFWKNWTIINQKIWIIQNLEKNSKILEFGNTKEKIGVLETLDQETDPKVLEEIILKLDDDDIRVRGEAFSSLLLNKNKISGVLIRYLNSPNKNIRGFVALVLANRQEKTAIPEIIKLTKDERAMVRSCAIGALSFLNAKEAKKSFLESLFDSNLEVKKSSLQAIINLRITISRAKIKDINKENDPEIEKLLLQVKKR